MKVLIFSDIHSNIEAVQPDITRPRETCYYQPMAYGLFLMMVEQSFTFRLKR